MNEKIENFIESMSLPRDIARVLFNNEDDCKLFFEDYYMRNKYVIDDLLDYREDKIKKSNKTVDLFENECYNKGMLTTFESTFYQSFTEYDMSKIRMSMLEGKTSLKQLFEDFQKNPNKNVLKNVL